MTTFELAIHDAHGVAVAARVRPDRVELCTALGTGGLTPSPALIDAAVATGAAVHVLVRPREGGFVYDQAERDLVIADARHAVRLGAAGVVVGGLDESGSIDERLVALVVDAVEGREVTFHRAFDSISERRGALDGLERLGVTRVLTSGGASAAIDALDELRALVGHAAGAIEVMAGAGVTSANAAVLAHTGVDAVHASAKRLVTERLAVSLGAGARAGTTTYATTDEAEAAAIQRALACAQHPQR